MRLLYIHGLHSTPNKDKNQILEKYTDFLFAPHIDYFEKKPIFSWLLEESNNLNINTLMGSSAGGLMAFWLNKYLGTQALLFNPALRFQSFIPDIIEPKKDELKENYYNYIILGEKDTVVKPVDTISYLKNNENNDSYVIDIRERLEHRIDLKTFEYACQRLVKVYNDKKQA